jgi:hypothetical protein
MSLWFPTRPKPTARKSSYAADFDEAERASLRVEQSKVEVTSRASKPATIYERLSRSSTASKL